MIPTWLGHWTLLCSFTSFFHFLRTSWLKAGRPGRAYFSWEGTARRSEGQFRHSFSSSTCLTAGKVDLLLPFCRPAPGLNETSSWASLWAGRCWRSQPGGSWPLGPTLAARGRWPSFQGWPPSGPAEPRLPHSSGASGKREWRQVIRSGATSSY